MLTQEGDSHTDFHLQWKIEYKSGFIGNNCKKVVYLGKEVYDTPACSLVSEYKRAIESESCKVLVTLKSSM